MVYCSKCKEHFHSSNGALSDEIVLTWDDLSPFESKARLEDLNKTYEGKVDNLDNWLSELLEEAFDTISMQCNHAWIEIK